MERVPPRFFVEAESRFPRLQDYDPAGHQFALTYLNPLGYTITVEDFPGMHLIQKGTDPDQQQVPGSASANNLHRAPNIYTLDCPSNTTGWRFTLSGHRGQATLGGPPLPRVNDQGDKHLVALTDAFPEVGGNNAWNWRFGVPGPGTYTVTVDRMSGTAVNETKTATLTLEDYLVVSIGDSAASGQGNPDIPGTPADYDDHPAWEYFIPILNLYVLTDDIYNWGKNSVATLSPQIARGAKVHLHMDPDPTWLEKEAYRSLRSGHAYAAQLLEDRAKGTLVTFLPFGRTDSEIHNGLIGPRTSNGVPSDYWIGNLGQVDEVRTTVGARRIDALLIYIGINDIGVSGTLEELVEGDSPILGQGDPAQARMLAGKVASDRLEALPQKFDELATVLSTLNVGQIYLTEYPTGLFDDVKGNPAPGCELFEFPTLNIDIEDAQLVQSIASQLNDVLKAAADKYHWIYVGGIDQRLRGRGYCTPRDGRAFVTCTESLLMQGDTEGTVHPNVSGHQVIAKAVAASVGNNTINKRAPGPVVGIQGPQPGDGVVAL